MRLQNIQAIPHPAGNRIDLSWESDDLTLPQTVCVIGCEGGYPASPFDGASYQLQTPLSATATGLQGETVYYFTLFVREQAKALVSDADAVYHLALDRAFLPESLRQALSAAAGTEIAADAQILVKEPGHKWLIVERSRQRIHTIEQETQSLGVCSYRFDPANRVSAMATAPYQLGQQLYELLPAIYRRYDTQLPLDPPATMPAKAHAYGQLRRFLEVPGGQLDQIYSLARALLHLYDLDRVDGRLLPLLADWIGWRTDPRRDLQQQRDDLRAAPYIQETIGTVPVVAAMIKRLNHHWDCRIKEFANNVLRANEPARLTLWSMLRSGDHWSTPTAPLSLDFAYEGRPSATCDDEGQLWLFYHTHRQGHWEICYKVNDQRMTGEWTPSVVLQPSSRQQMNRHPTALFSKGTLHLFWDRYDMAQQRWSLVYYTRTTGAWLERTKTLFAEQGGSLIERKQPWVVAVAEKELWLFWLERTTAQWQLRYSRYDGNQWGPATTFPATTAGFDGAQDLFVLNGPGNKLYLFWSRRVLASDGQKYWRIFYQVQHDNSWDPPVELPAPPEADDREPAATISGDTVELFWSSNRQGSWSIWHCTLADSQLASPIDGADAARTPLPLAIEAGVTLFYRSSATIAYTNPTARVSTLDTRYAGCTTVDPRNRAQIAQRGRFEDVTTYTYDISPARWPHDTPLYARDTIGIYFPDEVADDPQHQENLRQIEHFLTNFLPIQIRPVFPSKPPPPNAGFTMVTGRVLDGTNGNVPLSGATIELGADQTVSGTGGRFTLRAVPIAQGDLTITVRKEMDGKRLRAVKTVAAVGGDITNFGDVVINLVKFWDGGGGDNNWQNAANWNDDTLPQERDDVYIPRTAAVDLASGGATINSLYCDGELTLTGGTLVVADASSVHTLTLRNGMLAGSGAVTVHDAFTWIGGTLKGMGRTVVLGTLTLDQIGSRLTLDGYTLENRQKATYRRTASFYTRNGAHIINAAGATWDFQSGVRVDWTAGSGNGEQPIFENYGTLLKSAGETTFIDGRFVNNGTVQVQSGTLHLRGGGSGDGAYEVREGATLLLEGGHTLSSEAKIFGAGALVVKGEPVEMSGEYDITGTTTTSGGALHFTPAARVKELGMQINIAYAQGILDLGSRALALQNLSQAGGTLVSSGEVTVSGTFIWTGGTLTGGGRTTVSSILSIENQTNSTVALDGHTLENRGRVFCNRNAAVVVKHRARIINAADATWDFQNSCRLDWQKSQGDEEQPLFENQGTVVKSGGDPTAINCRFVNSGTLQVQRGTLDLHGGGAGEGLYEIGEGATLLLAGGHTLSSEAQVLGSGALHINGQAVEISGVYNLSGATTVSNNGSLHFTREARVEGLGAQVTIPYSQGVLDLGSHTVALQNLTQAGGTLISSGAVTVSGTFIWTGGTLTGGGQTIVSGTLTIGDQVNSSVVLDGHMLENREQVHCNRNAAVVVKNGARIINAADATWDFRNSCRLDWQKSQGDEEQPLFENQGTVVKSGGNPTAINCRFVNSGTVQVQRGTLDLHGGGAGEGLYEVGEGATLLLAGGHTLSSEAQVLGAGALYISGQAVEMSGAYNLSGTTTVSNYGSLHFTPEARVEDLGAQVDLAHTSGVLDLGSHALALQNLSQAGGTLISSGAVTIRGAFTWTGGTLTGGGQTVVSGTLTIGSSQSGTGLTLDGHTLENRGQMYCNRNAAVVVKHRARIINAADATWDFRNSCRLDWQKSQGDEEQPLFENQGTVVKSGGNPTAINCRFVNSGTLQLKMGVVTLSGDYTQTDAGQLRISIRGATEETAPCPLHVTAAMTLAGTLAIDRSSEYAPDLGVRLPIVQFKTRTDEFTKVDGDTIDDNRRFAVRYEEKVILLEVVKIA